MSTQALGSALSGLRAAQKGLDVVSNNIANASVDGYTAKSISQESVIAGNIGTGVRTGQITRFVDQAVQRDYRTQLGVDSYYNTRQAYLSRVIALSGSTDKQINIGAKLGDLYQSFVELSASPNAATTQQSIVNQASDLARSFNSFSQSLNDIRNETQGVIKDEIADLNNSLVQIADYNKRINGLQATGQSTAGLEDKRDILIKKVATQIDVTYYIDGQNMLILQTRNGQVLADDTARTITFTGQPVTPGSAYPSSLSGLLLNDSNPPTDLAALSPGGKIGALLDLRDKELPSYNAQLDELAHKIAVRFDDQGLRLFTNSAGVVPANNPTSYNGFANEIQVNDNVLASPSLLQTGTAGGSVNAGSNAQIMKVVNYTFGRYKDAANTLNTGFNFNNTGPQSDINFRILNDPNATLEQFAQAMLDGQASDYNVAKNTADTEAQYTQEVQKRLSDGSAVDTDQEMARMIELQRSYSSSAKVINALDQLFRELLNAI